MVAAKLQRQQGYAMAALLIGMSIAAVMMTALMPAWRQMSRREDET
ncbi:MAG TPA: type II secretion system protein [Gemmatimonadaceae bacterium]